MTKNLLYIISIYLLVLSNIACKKTSDYIKAVDNKTEYTIKLYFEGNSALNNADSVIIPPNTNLTYYSTERAKQADPYNICDPQINKNEVLIIVSDNKMLQKDITNYNNWTCETDEKNTFHKATFIIDYQDIN